MKFSKIISVAALAALLTSGVLAEEAAKTEAPATTATPVAGGVTVDLVATEIIATGYRASKIIGTKVYNKDGENIGKVDDLIVGGDSMVSFAVISVGGFLGMGSRHIAVPAILFETNDKGQIVLPDAKKEDLKLLPEFKYAK